MNVNIPWPNLIHLNLGKLLGLRCLAYIYASCSIKRDLRTFGSDPDLVASIEQFERTLVLSKDHRLLVHLRQVDPVPFKIGVEGFLVLFDRGVVGTTAERPARTRSVRTAQWRRARRTIGRRKIPHALLWGGQTIAQSGVRMTITNNFAKSNVCCNRESSDAYSATT